eukprot:gb/GECG01012790.1/.p1 GENE.gb/GECG01012790.1/~~gb/GECG01012790.1/.p1  ORF type:complete len:155 (+),score=23.77 gb/GECG01012790.1/:1-465(+)
MRAVYSPEKDSIPLQMWFPGLVDASSNQSAHGDGHSESDKPPDAAYLRNEILTRSDFDSSGMFFITQRSTLVGSAIAFAPPSSEESEVKWLTVHPDHRRHGVGTALVCGTMDLCCNYLSRKCKRNWVTMEIEDDNESAHKFLAYHGFKKKEGMS